jgi:hypothetical protein
MQRFIFNNRLLLGITLLAFSSNALHSANASKSPKKGDYSNDYSKWDILGDCDSEEELVEKLEFVRAVLQKAQHEVDKSGRPALLVINPKERKQSPLFPIE